MDILADTNILVRAVHRKSAHHRAAIRALRMLRARGDRVCVVPQNVYEFWAVATRPVESNGLGLTLALAARITARVEELVTVLRDPPELYDVWRRIVIAHGVSGKTSHDARLVAAMNLNSISHILTFNVPDFKRYADVIAIEPHSVLPPEG